MAEHSPTPWRWHPVAVPDDRPIEILGRPSGQLADDSTEDIS
jgi:hypothetical protein